MMIEIKVPSPGESITEVQLASWLVEDGDMVEKDQEIAEVDSDKATLTINAEEAGKLEIMVKAGETIEVGSVVGKIDTSVAPKAKADSRQSAVSSQEVEESSQKTEDRRQKAEERDQKTEIKPHLSPLARKLLEANDLSEKEFMDFLSSYRFGKKDVQFFLEERNSPGSQEPGREQTGWEGERETERKKMSTLRLKVAQRLVAVKNDTAMLTTFNEVNMSPVMNIRSQYKETFKEKHGVSLGFMSFFTKAITEALKLFPQVNAQIDGDEIVYHKFADIGIAVSTPKGLMVPVLRNAEKMSLAEIELKIKELAVKARDNKITLDEMKGGTFTITNGGVFGSMLSTPIINPQQSAILGMHNIVDRPVAINGQVEIHPIMYVALSYDHRIIDGKESVSFLMKVKEMLEDPSKMLFGGSDPVKNLLGV
jgi:2-oxoglutarate dehydrogenase E2 component (dihydrolipoamide succinyltransferase)